VLLKIYLHSAGKKQDAFLEGTSALFFGLFCLVCIIGILGEVL
jgi:hypothetical protein